MSNDNNTPFTNTELMMIALVLSQQADEYPYSEREIRQLSQKAREAVEYDD